MGQRNQQQAAALEYSLDHITVCGCGGAGFVRLDRQPGEPLFGAAIPCICQRDEQARLRAERLRATSGISETEMRWTFESFHPEWCRAQNGDRARVVEAMAAYKALCMRYAADPRGWLILQGEPGVGKTHLAYAIAGECIRRGRPAFAHTLPDLLQRLREAFGMEGAFEQALDDLKRVELLVIDDFGAQRDTSWALDTVYQIVNHRYAKRLPLVITTNLDLANAGDGISERLLSRLREGTETEGGWVRLLSLPAADLRPWKPER